MLLIKSFFRNRKNRIYLTIFIVLYVLIILLNEFNDYYENKKNELEIDSRYTIAIDNNDISEKLDSLEGISYTRLVTFTSLNENVVDYYRIEKFEDLILAYPDTYCGVSLNDDEIIVYTFAVDMTEGEGKSFIGQSINFYHNDKSLDFTIKDFISDAKHSYVCISSNLYNELLKDEVGYTYDLAAESYEDIERLDANEDADFKYMVGNNLIINNDLLKSVTNMLNILSVINILSIVVFIIASIFITHDLVCDLIPEYNLLKQMGFSNKQNIFNSLRNLIIFDVLILLIALFISIIIKFIFNKLFSYSLSYLNIKLVLLIVIFHVIVELGSLGLDVNRKERLD